MNVFFETDRSLLSELRQITEASESDGFTTGLQELTVIILVSTTNPILYKTIMGQWNFVLKQRIVKLTRSLELLFSKRPVCYIASGCLSTDTDTA